MSAKLKTALLGASGYSGLELTRILERHPRLERPLLLRRSENSNGASKNDASANRGGTNGGGANEARDLAELGFDRVQPRSGRGRAAGE